MKRDTNKNNMTPWTPALVPVDNDPILIHLNFPNLLHEGFAVRQARSGKYYYAFTSLGGKNKPEINGKYAFPVEPGLNKAKEFFKGRFANYFNNFVFPTEQQLNNAGNVTSSASFTIPNNIDIASTIKLPEDNLMVTLTLLGNNVTLLSQVLQENQSHNRSLFVDITKVNTTHYDNLMVILNGLNQNTNILASLIGDLNKKLDLFTQKILNIANISEDQIQILNEVNDVKSSLDDIKLSVDDLKKPKK